MFFPRLRNQAKWAFVLLILVFGGGFVFLGVGSGGLDLGQLLRDAFGNKGSSSGSVSKAQANVRAHPSSAAAYKQLADVLEKKGRTDEAITAWTSYTKLNKTDVSALRHLGDLELGQADLYLRRAQLASYAQQEASIGSRFGSTPGGAAQPLAEDPISSAVTAQANAELQAASAAYKGVAQQAVSTYQRLAKLRPKDEQALFSLAQAADTLRQVPVAVRAYKRLLEFPLDPATKAQIRQRIKTLQQSAQPAAGGR
jgi:tetratricopeptide (TPR) repeat protein